MTETDQLEPGTINAFPRALALLGLSPTDARLHRRRLATTGLLDCLPLAAVDDAHQIVLRASIDPELTTPGVALANIVSGETLLIAEGAATFVPVWTITRLIHASAEDWDARARLAAEDCDAILALHRRLGGGDELDDLSLLLADDGLRAALCRDLDGDLYAERLADAFDLGVPNDRRGRIQRVLRELFFGADGWIHGLEREDLGNWRPALEKALGVLARAPDADLQYRTLMAAARRPSGHDSAWAGTSGVDVDFGRKGDALGTSMLTARRIVRHPAHNADTTLAPAIAALAEHGNGYDGRAHLDCVKDLIASAEAPGAWHAALTACFWTYRGIGRVPAEMQMMMGRLAHDLSPERLWPVVARNLEAMGSSTEA